MARKRMIDPSFWRDEKIGQCSFMERLLFEGLWTFSEDNGVGRANPLLLKADIFPYDASLREADITKSLDKLSSLGLILLYEIDCQKYYYINNFKKHQTINKPTPSALPEPLPEHYGSTTVVLPPKIKEEKIKEREDKGIYERIRAMYNETCVSFPRCASLSDNRKKAIGARLKTYSFDDFKSLFEKAEASAFLKGANNRNWNATFDWLIKDANMAKVLDGNYDDKKKPPKDDDWGIDFDRQDF